ncbi:MAG: sugar ABC transporter substrate-binding protein, partial [Rubrobacter sp.]|nr:sugar ABC transporter substrate-binding protein [Rubrobacter sp.]
MRKRARGERNRGYNREFSRKDMLRLGGLLAVGTAAAPMLSACGSSSASGADLSGTSLSVATVNNSQMEDMASLIGHFTEQSGIEVEFQFLPENALRQRVTQDAAMRAGNYDVVTIGSYDAAIWARYRWIEPLDSYFSQLGQSERDRYEVDDLLEPIRTILSHEDQLFALPFYGESSMLFYRRDLFEEAGLQMPERPEWSQIAEFAQELDGLEEGTSGIILRGLPGWGANMAPFDTFINTFGGRWYNPDWEPQLTSNEVREAIETYSSLVRDYGQSGATSHNFPECQNIFASGDGAMWYDATSAAGYLGDPESSEVADTIGYAYGPTAATPRGAHWLYSWALAIQSTSTKKQAAFEFIKWATSKEYIDLVRRELGQVRIPPGTRQSTYDNTPYGENPWTNIELESINGATPDRPTEDPVPYSGIQYVAIPEFQQLGDSVGRSLASVLAGDMSADEMARSAQDEALQVARDGE